MSGRMRLAVTLGAACLVATPDLVRSVFFDHRLLRPDTRELARQWIEQNVPSGERILWCGYGNIVPHLTMPWLHVPLVHDEEHRALRSSRDLETLVDEAVIRWKYRHDVPTYPMVGVTFWSDGKVQSGFDAYPMLEHHYPIALLEQMDRWSRNRGWLLRESPRWDLMRRHVTETIDARPAPLVNREEPIVILTGMPCDPVIVRLLSETYEEVIHIDPGVPWSEYRGKVMYDLGDAWYLPNQGIGRVTRPGPEIRIFRKGKR